ncbi:MAG: HNH endonuclease signature motif containing protein [Acidobacteriota bacterium]|nr:HNH endonuclease signature motif containing protein [Acidobacteriota bacterium]
MNPHYEFVAERAEHRCEYCHAPERIFNFQFEVEHIRPRALRGEDDLQNLALACRACNLYKSIRIAGFDDVTQAEIRLFNPRQDDWADNFQIDLETGKVIGVTPGGRVTVKQLQMNTPAQLMARLQWIQWKSFP